MTCTGPRDGAHTRNRALPAGLYYGITKHAENATCTRRRAAAGHGFRLQRDDAAHVQRLRSGQALDNPYQGVLGISWATCSGASRSPSSATGSRRATSFTSTTSWTAGVPDAGQYGRVRLRDQPRLGTVPVDQRAGLARCCGEFGAGDRQIKYAPPRPGEQRAVPPTFRRAQSVLGWEPRTTFEAGTRQDRSHGPRRARRSRQECAMGLLFVNWVEPWVPERFTIRKYVHAAKAQGHTVSVYGEVSVYGGRNADMPLAPAHNRSQRKWIWRCSSSGCRRTSLTCPTSPAFSTAFRAIGALSWTSGGGSTTPFGWITTSTTWRSSTAT